MKEEATRVTIDDLARMVAGGFAEFRKDMTEGFAQIRTEMAEGFSEVRTEMAEGFSDVRQRVGSLEGEVRLTNQRLDEYISPTLEDHSRRIKDLELKVA
jgi:glutamyl-tRNA reductase